MIKPTPEEVTEYARKIGFILDGNAFCDYYESKGWYVGRSPMKVWQAAVRTWKHKEVREGWFKRVKTRQVDIDPVKVEEARKKTLELMEREWAKKEAKKIAPISIDWTKV